MSNTPQTDPTELERLVSKIKSVIAATAGIEPEKISEEALFIEDLGIDSLAAVELVFDLEQEFKVAFTEEEARGIRCLKDVRELVTTKIAAAGAAPAPG